MIQPIYLYGAEVLREKAKEADLSQKEYLTKLVADMKETLASADGCGLAAPQIGISQRVLIVDGTGMADMYDYLKDFRRVIINPVIVDESENSCTYNEGCLSVPGIYADVVRPAAITIDYYNEDLQPVRETFDKFACRMVQHEMSHLDGKLFVDDVAPIRKKMISKKLTGIAKGLVSTRYKSKAR